MSAPLYRRKTTEVFPMTYSYDQRKTAGQKETPVKAQSPASDVLSSSALLSEVRLGPPSDLPGAIREKFENAFGADLSAVRLYQSQAVADAGAEAVTMGEKVAFAPGLLDFTSLSGQTLLGHELSHVVSQQRGEVTGKGFLNDTALEARADREGAMAASGQQIAVPTAALSASGAAGASGPMQAKKSTADELLPSYHRNVVPLPLTSHLNNTPSMRNKPFEGEGYPLVKPTGAAGPIALLNNNIFKPGSSAFTSAAKLANTHYAGADKKQLTSGVWGGGWSPAIQGVGGGLGAISGLLTFMGKGGSSIRNYKNMKAGASGFDATEDLLDCVGGVGAMGLGGLTMFKSLKSKIGAKMPFYVRFTKVKHFFDICKKTKDNFAFLNFNFWF